MKLTAIHLQNYRAHRDLKVEFGAGFNVVAGINGSGKTSLLKGVGDGLMWMMMHSPLSFGTQYVDGRDWVHVQQQLHAGRYRFESLYPVRISVEGVSEGRKFHFAVDKANAESDPAYQGETPLGQNDRSNSREGVVQDTKSLPVIVFYRANRQWLGQGSNFMQAATEKHSRLDGYKGWWDAAVHIEDLQNWVISKCLERFQYSSETGKRFDEIDDDELALVNKALSDAIEGIGGLRYDMQQKSLLVDWWRGADAGGSSDSDASISFDHLSDGQRAVICLVADIARRMCLLNPQLGQDVTRKTPGIVLIDELDVHLHPAWQRRIVNGLKAAFPEVQFIATSHSPQVLGELRPAEIILLRDGGTDQPQVSYGLDSSQVLEEIMGAPSRNLDVEARLNQLFADIEGGRLDDAKRLLEELRKEAAQIPDLSGAEALIRRKELIGGRLSRRRVMSEGPCQAPLAY